MIPDAWSDPVEYWLDERDVIVRVNEGFRRFADANGAPGLAIHALGKSVWEQFQGYEVQEIYRAIFEDVRESESASRFEFRCDDSRTRRTMQMEIHPTKGGGLRLRSALLAVEANEDAMPLLEAENSTNLVRGCSFCSRIDGPPWMSARQAAEELRLLANGPFRMSHGVCPECNARVLEEFKARLSSTDTPPRFPLHSRSLKGHP